MRLDEPFRYLTPSNQLFRRKRRNGGWGWRHRIMIEKERERGEGGCGGNEVRNWRKGEQDETEGSFPFGHYTVRTEASSCWKFSELPARESTRSIKLVYNFPAIVNDLLLRWQRVCLPLSVGVNKRNSVGRALKSESSLSFGFEYSYLYWFILETPVILIPQCIININILIYMCVFLILFKCLLDYMIYKIINGILMKFWILIWILDFKNKF